MAEHSRTEKHPAGKVMTAKRRVTTLYISGITVSLGIAFYILGANLLGWRNPAGWLLFAVGVLHMLILIASAYTVPRSLRTEPGNQVQTAGYLHTLIGFSVALLLLQGTLGDPPQRFNLSLILGPLGSALLTSILGWFLGGEIIRSSGEVGIDPVRGELEALRIETARIVSELRGFADGVRRTHEDYLGTVTSLSELHVEVSKRQRAALDSSLKTATELSSHLEPLTSSVSGLRKRVIELSSELGEHLGPPLTASVKDVSANAHALASSLEDASKGALDAAGYLKESRILIEELERILDGIAATKGA